MNKLNPLRSEYLSHVEKQKASGLSAKKYCEQNNLIDYKFSYYQSYQLKTKQKSNFATVRIKSTQPAPVKAKEVNKIVSTNIDPDWLAQLINSLMATK